MFVCVLVYYFPGESEKEICLHHCALNLLTLSVKKKKKKERKKERNMRPRLNIVWQTGALPGFSRGIGGRRGEKGKGEREPEPGPGVSGRKRGEENWGVPLKPPLQIRGAERGSKWLVLCGWCETLKSQSHLQHSLHQVH